MTTYTNLQCAHVWAQQNTERGRSSHGSLYFEGRTIYSYGLHYPLAKIMPNGVVLMNSAQSTTTTETRHKPIIRKTAGNRVIYKVPNVAISMHDEQEHLENHNHLIEVVKHYISKAKTARTKRRFYLTQAVIALREADSYAEDFGIASTGNVQLPDNVDLEALLAQAEEAKRRIEEETRTRHAEKIEQWKRGERDILPKLDTIYLRVKGDELQTSWGARVPLDHAVKAFKIIARCRKNGTAWERNGHSIHVGHFQIDRISPNGDIEAGCHRILWGEIERIANSIGVEG